MCRLLPLFERVRKEWEKAATVCVGSFCWQKLYVKMPLTPLASKAHLEHPPFKKEFGEEGNSWIYKSVSD